MFHVRYNPLWLINPKHFITEKNHFAFKIFLFLCSSNNSLIIDDNKNSYQLCTGNTELFIYILLTFLHSTPNHTCNFKSSHKQNNGRGNPHYTFIILGVVFFFFFKKKNVLIKDLFFYISCLLCKFILFLEKKQKKKDKCATKSRRRR